MRLCMARVVLDEELVQLVDGRRVREPHTPRLGLAPCHIRRHHLKQLSRLQPSQQDEAATFRVPLTLEEEDGALIATQRRRCTRREPHMTERISRKLPIPARLQ